MVKISDIRNSSLNVVETKFYEVGLAPPCLLWVLQTLNLSGDAVIPRTEVLIRAQASHTPEILCAQTSCQ